MIIDVNTYLGHWPFRDICNNTAFDLAEAGEKNGITHMLVASLNAIFYKDSMKGNVELYYELQGYDGKVKFIPFAVINPTYPAWEQDMEDAVLKYGFQGIELCPLYHNYPLKTFGRGYQFINPAADAFRKAGELGVPVRINAGFENFRQRHHMDVFNDLGADEITALLTSCDKTTAIINGVFPYTLGDDLREILKSRENIFFDVTRMDTFLAGTIEKTLEYTDASHLCFGSLAPFQYIETNLAKLFFTPGLDSKKILSDNIRNYIKGI